MIITESEKVKKWFDSELSMRPEESLDSVECEEVKEICLNAIEEREQYRAIGTVEELKTAMKYVSLAKKQGTTGKAIDACAEYEAIGTVSEFRELKEKATAKKVFQPFGTHSYKCPTCWKFVAHEVDDNCDLEATMADYCPYCGQKLLWT